MRTDQEMTPGRRLDPVSLAAGVFFLAVALIWGVGGLRLGPETAWQLPAVLAGSIAAGVIGAIGGRSRHG